MNISKSFIILFLLFSFSCSHQGRRAPSSIEDREELEDILVSLAEAVGNPVDSSLQCAEGLRSYYQTLLSLTSKNINMNSLSGDRLEEMIKTSFLTRLEIQ